MKLSEKIETAARDVGCEGEIEAINAAVESLQNGKTKRIAVLGETNCGKTSLVNKIAGAKARKPTKLPTDEKPLMVTFGSGETKPEYEVVDVENSKCGEAQISLYEIPINMAIDYETRQIGPLLEEMDAVIYVISAIAPFTAEDAMNIGAIADKFPMLLYVSKAELLDGEEEYQTVISYIEDGFSEKFDGITCEILDSRQPDAVEGMMKRFGEVSLEELREFHRIRLEQQAEEIVEEGRKRQIRRLEAERKEREAERAAKDAEYREQFLIWDGLRVEMREREQKAMDAVEKKITMSKNAVKKELLRRLKETKQKKEWVNHELRKMLQNELREVSDDVAADLKDRTAADAAWLVSEVNRKSGIKIAVEDMGERQLERFKESPDGAVEEPGYRKVAAAAGAGLLAGGAVSSGMSLLPTCMVAIPASLAAFYLLKGDSEEREQYNRKLLWLTEKCCDKNFAALEGQTRTAIHKHYEKMAESIKKIGMQNIDEEVKV